MALRVADAQPPDEILAVGYLGPSGYKTYAAPQRFIGSDGRTYRVKIRAHQGLGAELIGNRIARYLGVGPHTAVIRISAASVPRDGTLDHYIGSQLASAEIDDVFNDDELRHLGLCLPFERVDWDSWALVVCLQTWLYVRDPQAVIGLADGRVYSIDHGDCFGELAKGPPTGVIVPGLYGVSGVPFDASSVGRAVASLESVSEEALIDLIARVPDSNEWRMPFERRLRVTEWLLDRQPLIREVVEPWMKLA